MSKKILNSLSIPLIIIGLLWCNEGRSSPKFTFGTEGLYAPFEYYDQNKLTGFDIELAELIAEELGKEAEFVDMQFSSLLPALDQGQITAVIAALGSTEERKKNFDFSDVYYSGKIAILFHKNHPISSLDQLEGHKIACQLGSLMVPWVQEHVSQAEVVTMDTANQEVEALKAGHVEAVILEGIQAPAFVQKNPELDYMLVTLVESGYRIAVKKGDPILLEINKAIHTLQENGKLKALQEKWLG